MMTALRTTLVAMMATAMAVPAFAQTSGTIGMTGVPKQPKAREAITDGDYVRTGKSAARLRLRDSGNPLQVRAAANLAAGLKLPCDVTDAAELSDRPSKNPSYELVCKDNLGWVISRGSDGQTLMFDCLALQDSAKAAGASWPVNLMCLMRGNLNTLAGLAPIAAKAAPDCQVDDGAYLGAGGTPPIIRYELHCKSGKGYVVDNPAPGSAASLSVMSCADAAQAGAPCKLADRRKAG